MSNTLQWGRDHVPTPLTVMMEQEGNPGKSADTFATLPAVEKVLALLRCVGSLNVRIDLEHSFKAVHGRLLGDRLLLCVQRPGMQNTLDAGITSICEEIGMPQNLLASFAESLPAANHVYFGAEQSGEMLIFKTYLEFRHRIEKQMGGSRESGPPQRLFTGFKWDTSSPSRQAVTSYDWYPFLSVPAMLERMRTILNVERHRTLLEIVSEILELAAEKTPFCDLQYLEVTEAGNARRSFDINVYKAGLRLANVLGPLREAARHYAISTERFGPLLERTKSERFGHVAAGVDREDRDFMTVYYGVKPVESGRLRTAVARPQEGTRSGTSDSS